MIIQAIKKKIELSKAGKPFARVLVQFDEYRDGKGNRKWLSGFGNKRTWAWEVGDDVQPEVTENGQYLNFSFDERDENRLNIYDMPATIGFVMELVNGKQQSPSAPAYIPKAPVVPDDPNDIPF